jgi:uncharacterized protein YceK
VWQGVRIGLRLITMMLCALQLCGCWTTFSVGTAAQPAASYRASVPLDEDRGTDMPTPQLFNFGFDLPKSDPGEP